MYRTLILLILLLAAKMVSAAELSPPKMDAAHFLAAMATVQKDVASPVFNNSTCVPYLKTLSDEIDQIDVRSISPEIFNRDAQLVVDASWGIRQSLHSRLSEFDLECVNQIQANFRQFRFIEEYLLEHLRNVQDLYPEGHDFPKETTIPMKDTPSYYAVNGAILGKTADFIPGDLMIA